MFQNLILAFIFGTLVAIGAVLLLEYLDLTLKNVDDTQQRLQLRVLGAIPLEASSARARA
jgi:capsular polysaccharide biosynthesis protein